MKSWPSRLTVLLLCLGTMLLYSPAPSAEHGGEAKSEPAGEAKGEAKAEAKSGEKTEHGSEPLAANQPPFELSIRPDTQSMGEGVSLLKLKKTDTAIPSKSIGEIVVRWTSPTGHRTSFPMKAVSDDVWANRMTMDSPAGRGSMSVVILGRTENGTLGRTTELIYDFDMPGLILTYKERKDLGESNGATRTAEQAAREPAEKKKFAWSLPVIAIFVMIANLILLIPVLIVINFVRKLSKGKKRLETVISAGDAAVQTAYGKVLAGAGLIDHQGEPVAWEESVKEENSAADDPAGKIIVNPKQKTALANEKGPFRAYTAEEVNKMTTEAIFELVDDTLERMEISGSSDEFKEMIRIAEKELARRDQEREAKEGMTESKKLVTAGATFEDDGKFDLKNLSF